MQPAPVSIQRPFRSGRGIAILAVCFVLVSVVVETAYSWRSLGDAYFLVKVAGWILLSWGAMQIRAGNPGGLAFLAAGWGWMAANFWRAIADRLTDISAGQSLRLGSVEIIFAGSCLAVCLTGLILTLVKANRN
ncbi:MAG: hypothetical protein A3J29_03740 [Acidobacteria bacterium RIFCSPLOWO2_12_FULL_67_14b]|nr:MAG: hypothetical protein A3J29_03740 [Acidobacteria bacterium RIFCSPLOWO2_12_FULL_67_14b]